MTYLPSDTRYDTMTYRRSGRSGLKLPAITLGLWYNFGGVDSFENGRAMIHRAFDLHGPPPGSTGKNSGRILAG